MISNGTGNNEEEEEYEAVGVNQRHLIDKILARYATEFTLFRELCQNADDAKASKMTIEFTSESKSSTTAEGEVRRRGSSGSSNAAAPAQAKKKKRSRGIWGLLKSAVASAVEQIADVDAPSRVEKFYTAVTVKNDGDAFSDADWNRVKNIASGNPDESKVGFFGVGFYSVFSLAEEPKIVSGDRSLGFFWKGDQLFVSRVPRDGAHSALWTAADAGWTSFQLVSREPEPMPS